MCCSDQWMLRMNVTGNAKAGSTLVTLPRNVTPYRDSVEETRDRVTYQKFVTWSRGRVTNF